MKIKDGKGRLYLESRKYSRIFQKKKKATNDEYRCTGVTVTDG